MKWYFLALSKYATFTGRSRRKEFWWFVVINIVFTILTRILDRMLGLSFSGHFMSNGWIGTVYGLAMFIPALAVNVRRLHDIGKSGWVYVRFLLAFFIGSLAYVVSMVMTVMKDGGVQAIQDGDFDPTMYMGSFMLGTLIYVLVALALTIWYLALMFRDSQPGENKWGPNPKGVGMQEGSDYIVV